MKSTSPSKMKGETQPGENKTRLLSRLQTFGIRSRITRRMLLHVGIVGLFCSILYTAAVEFVRYNQVIRATDRQLEQVAAIFAPTLAESIWAFDESQTILQLQSILQLPGISSVALRSNDHDHRFGLDAQGRNTLIHRLEINYLDTGRNVRLGTLEIGSDLSALNREFLNSTVMLFLGVVAICLVVLGSTVLIYQKNIVNRLLPIARELRNLSAADLKRSENEGSLVRPVELQDEIDELTSAVVAMRETAGKALIDLENAALHDSLTGLMNRRALEAFLERRLATGDPETNVFSVLNIDLDGFKAVNDKHGHAIGDALLVEVANSLRHATKSIDAVARVGGDEFVVVLSDVSQPEQTSRIADRIIAAISQPRVLQNVEVRVGASIGIAFRSAEDNSTTRLLMNADIATYNAKREGRGRSSFYAKGAREALAERLQTADDFRRAIANGEIAAFFQPQVDMISGHLSGLEALVRWHHPSKGILSPAAFLDVVLDAGLSGQLAMAVVDDALRALSVWRDMGFDVPKIGVNLAAEQLRDHEFTKKLEETVWNAGVASEHIAIEVLESVLVENARDPVVENIRELSNMGFPIELDDFGTGYSSISNLVSFKVNRIKIDRKFIAGIDKVAQQQAIFTALHGLARNLGIDILAEGVETQMECDKLLELGCSVIQGYYIARPMDFDATTEWLEARTSGATATA